MKFLLALLTAVVLAAGFFQLRTWGHQCALYVEQISEVDQACADKVRAMAMTQANPHEKMFLETEIERLRRQSQGLNQQLITDLRTKPFGLPLRLDEKAALANAVTRLHAIEQERLGDVAQRDLDRERERLAAEERARHRTGPPPPPKPGDWMWKERSVTPMDKSYK